MIYLVSTTGLTSFVIHLHGQTLWCVFFLSEVPPWYVVVLTHLPESLSDFQFGANLPCEGTAHSYPDGN